MVTRRWSIGLKRALNRAESTPVTHSSFATSVEVTNDSIGMCEKRIVASSARRIGTALHPAPCRVSSRIPFRLKFRFVSLVFLQRLQETIDDPTVAAVVLRVDSPGGSAVASDSIAAVVRRIKAEGKPVVCSMGDLAASGGYMIAAACDTIVAQPTTITGSIGVIAVKLSVQR